MVSLFDLALDHLGGDLHRHTAELAPAFDKILKENGINQPIERVEAVVGMMKMKKINF
jgi:glutamyl-tRNA synthetase